MIRDTWMRFVYVSAPLWFPFYLIYIGEDRRLVAASVIGAVPFFILGLFLHGSVVAYNFWGWLCVRLGLSRD